MTQLTDREIGIPVPRPTMHCEDTNCPFHGNIVIRGNTTEGRVVSARMDKTVVIEKEYLHFIPKYKRYERRRRRLSVHAPPCLDLRVGDEIIAAETRPISKTVSFVAVGKRGQ